MLTRLGAIHLAEEVKNPKTAVPKALMSTVFIGFGTAFAFVIAMLYSLNDFEAVLATPTGFVTNQTFLILNV